MGFYRFSFAVLGLAALATGCSTTGESSSAATGPSSSSPSAQQVALADDDPQKVRCKRYESTGSRISNKVCKTNAEWEEIARQSRESAESIQRESVQTSGIIGN